MAAAPIDPTRALESARRYARKLNGESDLGGPFGTVEAASYGHELAETFRDLDGWLTAGGLWPQAWQPPITHDGDGHLPNVHAARYRLELVIDKAFRDDERADRGTNVESDRAKPAVLRDHLVQLAAQAVLDEVDAERRQAEAVMQHMLTQQLLGMRRTQT